MELGNEMNTNDKLTEQAKVLRDLADVIRRYGNCNPVAIEAVAARIEAITLESQAVKGDAGVVKKIISDTIGFDFDCGSLQTVNDDDLLRIAAALAAQQQEIEAVEPFGWFITSHNDGYGRQETFTRAPVMKALVEHSYSGAVDTTPLWDHPPATQGDARDAERYRYIATIKNVWSILGGEFPNKFPSEADGCKNLSESIDAAIAAQAGGEG